jgi:hypothetical protein
MEGPIWTIYQKGSEMLAFVGQANNAYKHYSKRQISK